MTTHSTFDWTQPAIYANGSNLAIKYDNYAFILDKAQLVSFDMESPPRQIEYNFSRINLIPDELITLRLELRCPMTNFKEVYDERGVNIKFKESVINLLNDAYQRIVKRDKNV